MKVKIDSFLSPDAIPGATKDKPVLGKILSLQLIKADDLPFDSDEDRYELSIELKGDKYSWLVNKTTLREIKAKYGEESDDWAGKSVKLYIVDQNVAGKMKKVIYGTV